MMVIIVASWKSLPHHAAEGRGAADAAATYLDNVIAATVDQASHLFGWVKQDVEPAAQLAEAGRIATEMRVEGLRAEHLVSARV